MLFWDASNWLIVSHCCSGVRILSDFPHIDQFFQGFVCLFGGIISVVQEQSNDRADSPKPTGRDYNFEVRQMLPKCLFLEVNLAIC